MQVKRRTWDILEAAGGNGDRLSRAVDLFILSLIVLNVVAVVAGSVRQVQSEYGRLLAWFEIVSVSVFTIEYLLRVWSCTVNPEYARPIAGRLKFMFELMPLFDLLAILPFYLPFVGVDLRFLRILRLMRIIRIFKVARYYGSLQVIRNVFVAKKEELVLSLFVMILLLILSASLMYSFENGAQPEVFPNIPTTMWWAVTTLTTVGYGDIYPVTTLGKLLAAVISVLGIAMFALPTGILGAGFVEETRKQKARPERCPHCGKDLTCQDGKPEPESNKKGPPPEEGKAGL